MEQQTDDKEYQESRNKAKRNLMYFGIFGIIMFFSGLSSAYIVLLGDTFWVSFKWPMEFYTSTAVLLVSSLTIYLAVRGAKADDYKKVRLFVGITLFLGIAFTYLQIRGYGALSEGGNFFVSNIVVVDGKYDDYYYFTYQDKKIEFDGYDYSINGEVIDNSQVEEMRSISTTIFEFLRNKTDQISSDYGKDYLIFYGDRPVTYANDNFYLGDSLINTDDRIRLEQFAMNLHRRFGDFFMRGRYGEDFYLNYRGIKLDYIDRELQADGKKLSVGLLNKLVDTRNLASTFLYMLSALHILHLLGGLIYLIVLFRKSLKNSINSNNIVGLKNGAIYWHFLDILWIYLLLFLNFIH